MQRIPETRGIADTPVLRRAFVRGADRALADESVTELTADENGLVPDTSTDVTYIPQCGEYPHAG